MGIFDLERRGCPDCYNNAREHSGEYCLLNYRKPTQDELINGCENFEELNLTRTIRTSSTVLVILVSVGTLASIPFIVSLIQKLIE